jgi:hypothetical protein
VAAAETRQRGRPWCCLTRCNGFRCAILHVIVWLFTPYQQYFAIQERGVQITGANRNSTLNFDPRFWTRSRMLSHTHSFCRSFRNITNTLSLSDQSDHLTIKGCQGSKDSRIWPHPRKKLRCSRPFCSNVQECSFSRHKTTSLDG